MLRNAIHQFIKRNYTININHSKCLMFERFGFGGMNLQTDCDLNIIPQMDLFLSEIY